MRSQLEIIIKIGSTDYDISNDVDVNSIKIQDRADWSFEHGSFSFESGILDKNIPPYSFVRIREYEVVSNTTNYLRTLYFLISSQTTRNFVRGVTIHDCSLLSIDALLECYILGSKTWTDETDSFVMLKTLDLINIKYSTNITLETYALLTNAQHDYTFGTGTSLYEVVRQVANKNKMKFSVYFDDSAWSYDIYTQNIKIQFYSISTMPTLTINNSFSYLLNMKYLQNPNDYCKYLETEASNVVDRDKDVVWKDLSLRFPNVKFNDEELQLILPTNVEGINSIEVKGSYGFTIGIDTTAIDRNWIDNHGGSFGTTHMTYQELIDANVSYGVLSNLFNYYYTEGLYRVDGIKNKNCDITDLGSYVNIIISNTVGGSTFTGTGIFDYSDRLVEQDYFKTISDSDKHKYIFYKSGSNVIDNFVARYHDDLWGYITNLVGEPFLVRENSLTITIDSNNECRIKANISSAAGSSPDDYLYKIKAIALTNPKIVDSKNVSPANESAYKNFTRTYQMGNSDGMTTYFDALVSDMDQQNETLGRIESVVEIDTTTAIIPQDGQTYPSGTYYMPFANQPVSLFGNTFYVASLEHRFTSTKRYTQLNLTRTRYKIADAIGVDYQFNSILIPTQMVIDRPLYFEITNSSLYTYLYNDYQVFLRVDAQNNLAKRCAVSKDSDGAYYLYCEAIDNYAFDRSIDGTIGKDVSYVAYDGKVQYISLTVCVVDSMTLSDSKSLPYASAISGSTTRYDVASSVNIYKDTRERITFTIKVKNS